MPVPLLPIDLLRIPLFSLSICTSICSFCAQMLAMVSLPFFLQSMMGRSEVETGLLLTPWPLATMVMAPLAGYLIEKVHAGLLGAIGLLVMACGLFGLALLPSAPTDLDIIWRMALCGAGFGLFQSPNNHTIVSSAPAHRSGGASGMLGTARLLGQKKIRSPKVADFCFITAGNRALLQIFAAAQGFNTLIQRRVSHKQLAHGFRFTVNAERHHAAGFLRLIAGFQALQRGDHFLTPDQFC